MEPKSIKEINDEISLLGNKGNISDGSHTFEELYFHRMVLFATVCNANRLKSWKSKNMKMVLCLTIILLSVSLRRKVCLLITIT